MWCRRLFFLWVRQVGKTGYVPLVGTCFENGSELWVEGQRVMRLLKSREVCGAGLRVDERSGYISLEEVED